MAAVDHIIQTSMSSHVPMIPELAAHLINAGGKRVRPMVTLGCARMLDYDGVDHHRLAATVEFIHTATLLHDDVVDESALRRGRASANTVWGNAASVLVGDFLFARAFNLMVEPGSLRILEILSNTSSIIAEGEVAQLAAANNIETTTEEYFTIIDGKTAALFGAASQVAAVLAERNRTEEEALAVYGRELGLAFQLVDDVLDYGGVSARLGKRVGDDFREGKVTLPVILALREANADERQFWLRVMENVDQTDDDLGHAISILEKYGALTGVLATARRHADAACQALSGFPDNAYRNALIGLANFVVERVY